MVQWVWRFVLKYRSTRGNSCLILFICDRTFLKTKIMTLLYIPRLICQQKRGKAFYKCRGNGFLHSGLRPPVEMTEVFCIFCTNLAGEGIEKVCHFERSREIRAFCCNTVDFSNRLAVALASFHCYGIMTAENKKSLEFLEIYERIINKSY